MVQQDSDKEEEPWYAIYGTLLADLELQRTIKNGIGRLAWSFHHPYGQHGHY